MWLYMMQFYGWHLCSLKIIVILQLLGDWAPQTPSFRDLVPEYDPPSTNPESTS